MKIRLLFLLSIISWDTYSQTGYKLIPETNATWIQSDFLYSTDHEHVTKTVVVYTQEDTLINGLVYRKFGSHGIADWIDNFGPNQTSGTSTIVYEQGYFRQDSVLKKVYVWNNTSQSDELLYDFANLTIGQPYPQTITNMNYPNLLVMGTDSVQMLDGNYYKRWVLGTDSSDSAYVSVIEGIGGSNGFTTMLYPVFEQSSYLLCHKTDNQHIYENWVGSVIPPRYSAECSQTLDISLINQPHLTIYPNPAQTTIHVDSEQKLQSIGLLNLNGQVLMTVNENELTESTLDIQNLENGMYILQISLKNGTMQTHKVYLAH